MNIRVRLGDYLAQKDISAYRLAQEADRKLAKNTVYSMARGETKRVDLETLSTIMIALERLTGEAVTFDDLLERAGDTSASGLPYTGDAETDAILDDPDTAARLLAHKQAFEGLSHEERKKKIEAMLDSGELVPLERILAEIA
ncbi:MAG: helix-turn-helix transcriptional regulator [Trueperaceae bacterium]